MNDENKGEIGMYTIVKMQNNKWTTDSIGCYFRTLELADSLIITNDLLGKSSNEFIKIFGEPNKIVKRDTKKFLIYYMNTFCRNGKLIDGADKSWVEFDFENDKLMIIPRDYAIE